MHSQNGLAAGGHLCALNGLRLAAGAGELHGAYGFAGRLTGEIHLQRRVDGHELVVAADGIGVVGIGAGLEEHHGVVVQKVIQPTAAHGKRADAHAVVEALLGVVHGAALNEIHHGLRKHLRVDAQMLLGLQLVGHGIGNVADAQLDGGAVLHQRCHILADDGVLLRVGRGIHAQNGTVGLHQRRDLGNVHHGVAEGAGIVGVHLHQQHGAGAHHIHLINGADGQGHIPPRVHGGHGGQQHGAAVLVADAIQRFAQNAGGVLGHGADQMLGVGLAQSGGEEPTVVRHDGLHGRVVEGGIVHGGDAALQDEILHPRFLQVGQLVHKCVGAGGGHRRENEVAALNMLQHLTGGHFLPVILLLILVHKRSFPCLAESFSVCCYKHKPWEKKCKIHVFYPL